MSDWDNETAEWYAEKFGEYPTNRLAVDLLELPADATVVDVGCGTGSALRRAAAVVTRGTLIGVDPVPRMIEIARERTAADAARDRIEYRLGAAETLPVLDGVADFVLAFDSIDHWKDRDRGLAEVRRVLRPAGMFVLVKDGGLPGGLVPNVQLREALDRAGLEILEERQVEEGEVSFSLWICESVASASA